MTDHLSDPSADAQRIGEIVRRMCDGIFNADWLDVEWLLQRVAQAEQASNNAWRVYKANIESLEAEHKAEIARLSLQLAGMREALKALRIDANRLCDRQLGGTYEDDCRRSITLADAALHAAQERGTTKDA